MPNTRPVRYCWLAMWIATAATCLAADDVYRIGNGVTPPRLIHKTEPKYTPEARNAQIQGVALFEIVIGTDGRPTDITLISPIGFGLDERAQETIATLTGDQTKWITGLKAQLLRRQ